MKEKTLFGRNFVIITIGLFFLINPLFHVLDILPDLFGFLLIYVGASKIAVFDGRLESALKKIQYLIAVSAVKIIITYSVMSSALDSDRLLASFCFAIVEILLLIIVSADFFEGFSYVVDRNDGKQTAAIIPNVRFLTILFFLAKIILSVVPGLYSLIEAQQHVDITNEQYYWSLLSTKGIVSAFTILVVFVLGIIWYINIAKMFITAKNDTELNKNLFKRYSAEYLAYPEKQNYKTMKTGLYTALFAFIFFFNISVDGIRILPTALGIIFIAISALILKSLHSFKKTLRLAPFVIITQLLTEAFRYTYADTDSVFFSDLNLTTVAVSSFVVVINACILILFLSKYLSELSNMYSAITNIEIPTFGSVKFIFLIFTIIQSLQIVLPFIHADTSALSFFIVGLWIFLIEKRFIFMIEKYANTVKLL